METSITHCFNITGWRKYAHQRLKFSTVVKLYMHINSHTKLQLPLSITS